MRTAPPGLIPPPVSTNACFSVRRQAVPPVDLADCAAQKAFRGAGDCDSIRKLSLSAEEHGSNTRAELNTLDHQKLRHFLRPLTNRPKFHCRPQTRGAPTGAACVCFCVGSWPSL